MPRGDFNVLRDQTRKMVHNVYTFMKKEADDGPQFDLKAAQKRTAAATGVSIRTIKRIRTEANDPNNPLPFLPRTPGKKRKGMKKVTDIDKFDLGVVKRLIHNFHITEKQLPSVSSLLKKLKEIMEFKGSASSLRRIIKDLGFKWILTEDNRKVLIEHSNIRLKRIEYLRKLSKFRADGRHIVYTHETYVSASFSLSETLTDSSTKGQKKNLPRCYQLEIAHAGSEAGFVPNALLMFKAGTKTGDYHDKMNYTNYEKWLQNKLIPDLPENSVVIIDNTSYHNELESAAPLPNARKSVMESWLLENDIPFHTSMLKPELYKLICLHKDKLKCYRIDRILKEKGHTVLRLPPHHPDLNPIEIVWAAIKREFTQNNVATSSVNSLIELVASKVFQIGEQEWAALCRKVQHIEEEYKECDIVIDNFTDEYKLNVSESDTNADSEKEEDSDSDSSIDEPVPSSNVEVTVEEVDPLLLLM